MTTENATKQADAIFDSVNNGQFEQAREQAKKLTRMNIITAIDYLKTFRTDYDGAMNAMKKAFRA